MLPGSSNAGSATRVRRLCSPSSGRRWSAAAGIASILLAFAGVGIGCITKDALDIPRPSLHDQGLYGFIATVAPLAIAIALSAGLRYLFSLPLALGANWLFQMTEPDDRGAFGVPEGSSKTISCFKNYTLPSSAISVAASPT